MVQVAPSLLTADLAHLADELAAAKSADLMHLDVMDGQFVPPLTFGPLLAAAVVKSTAMPVEAHLMVVHPQTYLEPFKDAGCFRIIAHPEADPHFHRLALEGKRLGLEVGAALNPATGVESIRWLLPVIDMVLVMTVNPGWGGQAPIVQMLDKITEVRRLGFRGTVGVDGGVDPDMARAAAVKGADELVAGSYVYGPGRSAAQQIARLRDASAI